MLLQPLPKEPDNLVLERIGAQQELRPRHDLDDVHDDAELGELLERFEVDGACDGCLVKLFLGDGVLIIPVNTSTTSLSNQVDRSDTKKNQLLT